MFNMLNKIKHLEQELEKQKKLYLKLKSEYLNLSEIHSVQSTKLKQVETAYENQIKNNKVIEAEYNKLNKKYYELFENHTLLQKRYTDQTNQLFTTFNFNKNNSINENIASQYDDVFIFKEFEDYSIIEKYIGFNQKNIKIPSYYKSKKVIGLSSGLFINCENIQTVELGENITSIPLACFSGCKNLKEVKFNSNSLIYIGNRAFENCTSLIKLEIPNSVRIMGEEAFLSSGIQSITLPTKLNNISKSVFANCIYLKEIIIPNGITDIGFGAFKGCKNLKFVNLPQSLQDISNNAFLDCINLTSIDIPQNVKSIGTNSFSNSYIYQPDLRYNPVTMYKNRDIIISCKAGSYAQIYARNQNLKCEKSTKSYESRNEREIIYLISFKNQDTAILNFFNKYNINFVPFILEKFNVYTSINYAIYVDFASIEQIYALFSSGMKENCIFYGELTSNNIDLTFGRIGNRIYGYEGRGV